MQHLRSAGHAVQLVRPRQRAEPERDDGEEWRTAGCPIPMYPALRFGWASAASFREHWSSLQMSGSGIAPSTIGSAESMIARVAGTAGAIGYVLESELPADLKGLRIIRLR